MIKKVTVEVLKGILAGQKYEYEGEKRILIGRQADCEIIMPDKTVSKHHCLLEISSYEVKLSDVGSLNGTYINNRMIGQWDNNRTYDEAMTENPDENIVRNGDEIGLGRSCSLRCLIDTEDTVPEEVNTPDNINDNPIDYKKLEDEILEELVGPSGQQKSGKPLMFDGYRKISCLGRGGWGRVWKVQDPSSGKYYALKSMVSDVDFNDDAKRLILRESGINEFLSHKNVIKTYKTDLAEGKFYFLMDLCEGGNVSDLIKRKGGKLPLETATWIMLQVLSGLDYIHNVDIDVAVQSRMFSGKKETSVKGIVHRDLKPENIYLSDYSDFPVAMIGDFGMAKAYELAGLSRNTNDGNVCGSGQFMCRQQALDCRYSKPEVDVWAVAATYFYMLTGKYAKKFKTDSDVWYVVMSEKARPIRSINPAIPQEIAQVIDKALTEEPKIGFSTAEEFRKELVAALPANLKNAVQEVI